MDLRNVAKRPCRFCPLPSLKPKAAIQRLITTHGEFVYTGGDDLIFTFTQIKVYKKNFTIFISVLLLICVLAAFVLCTWMFNYYASNHRQISQDAFHRMEGDMDACIIAIDIYVESIYANKYLLEDFLFYFDNTATDYFTQRLSNQAKEKDVSFINDCKNFVSRNNYVIKQISFSTDRTVNRMRFENDGTMLSDFNISPDESSIQSKDISLGYLYIKKLPNPDHLTEYMGEIQFLIDTKQIFSVIAGYDVKNAAVMSTDGSIPLLPQGEDTPEFFRQVYESGVYQGSAHTSLFNTSYYSVFPSEKYGFSLITCIDSQSIIRENSSTFLLVICAIFLLFVIMTVIIAARLDYDAKYLKGIINFIDNMTIGAFDQKKIQHRNDEYSLIAHSLNDMADKINLFIEREYLLKLDQQKAEMKALENQINPHFLYNTLEIIRSKAYLNGDKVVSDAVYNLGSMYRAIVKGKHTITIEEELAILTKYLKLMEFKFDENFYYQIVVPDSVRQLKTVKFWMQPIVENFFAHGFDKSNPYNLMLILGEETDDAYILRFVDNGCSISQEALEQLNASLTLQNVVHKQEESQDIGLKNVYLRLRYFYGESFFMKLYNNEESGITVQVEIKKEDPHVQPDDC